MADCIFCGIIKNEVPAKKVHEDEQFIAFEDINPVAPTHILIIPKQHIPTLNEVSQEHREILGGMTLLAKEIAIKRGISDSGYRLVTNCMEGAGQSVFHIHMHLLGGRIFSWPPG